MDEHTEAPRSEGGNTKYAVIGLVLLLGGGAAIYTLTKAPPPAPRRPTPTATPDAAAPTTPTVGAQIELPPEEPDAGPPPEAGPPRIRYVTRYVDACPGTLTDPGGVARTAQASYGSLRACYERELRGNPQLRGRLTARLIVTTTGHIQDVNVSTAMNSRPLAECVKTTLRRLTVPPSRGGCATYDVNFNFAPRE